MWRSNLSIGSFPPTRRTVVRTTRGHSYQQSTQEVPASNSPRRARPRYTKTPLNGKSTNCVCGNIRHAYYIGNKPAAACIFSRMRPSNIRRYEAASHPFMPMRHGEGHGSHRERWHSLLLDQESQSKVRYAQAFWTKIPNTLSH